MARAIAGKAHPARCLFLDAVVTVGAALSDLEGFVGGLGGPAVIAKVERELAVALAIKAALDRRRHRGRFPLTGSASAMRPPELSESLPGKVELYALWRFSQGEMAGRRETFVDRLFARGSDLVPSEKRSHCFGGAPRTHSRRAVGLKAPLPPQVPDTTAQSPEKVVPS